MILLFAALTSLASETPAFADLALDSFVENTLSGGAAAYYKVWLSASTSDLKIVLLPLEGDADALISFDPNATALPSDAYDRVVAAQSFDDRSASQLAVNAYAEPRATAPIDAGTPHEDAIQHDGAAARRMPHTPRLTRGCPASQKVSQRYLPCAHCGDDLYLVSVH